MHYLILNIMKGLDVTKGSIIRGDTRPLRVHGGPPSLSLQSHGKFSSPWDESLARVNKKTSSSTTKLFQLATLYCG